MLGILTRTLANSALVSATLAHMTVMESPHMATRRTVFVSMNVTIPARDSLQRAALGLHGDAGRRLSMSDVLIAALAVAGRHRDEWVAELIESHEEGTDAP